MELQEKTEDKPKWKSPADDLTQGYHLGGAEGREFSRTGKRKHRADRTSAYARTASGRPWHPVLKFLLVAAIGLAALVACRLISRLF